MFPDWIWAMHLMLLLTVFLAFEFCRFCVVIRCFHPRHNGQWPPTSNDFYTRSYTLQYFLIEGFIYQILSITLFSYFNSWEKASISLFQCCVLNKGTTGTIFITSLVWRGPWLGIEPSCTRSQHYITKLSRRRECWQSVHYSDSLKCVGKYLNHRDFLMMEYFVIV